MNDILVSSFNRNNLNIFNQENLNTFNQNNLEVARNSGMGLFQVDIFSNLSAQLENERKERIKNEQAQN